MTSIKILDKQKSIKGCASNYLKFKLSGPDINYVIVNTIVRIGLSLVGSFAFNPLYINIDKNTSIFNIDQMKLRIANIPIINKDYKKLVVANTINLVDKCIELEIEANESIFQTKKDNLQEIETIEMKKKELLNNLYMFIEAKNTTNDIMDVTTNDQYTSFFLNDTKIPDIYPKEVLIIKLKPGEEFVCNAVADFNIPMINNMYSTVSVFAYDEINDHEFDIVLESQRQIEEEDIIKRCCMIAIKKLHNIQAIILEKIQLSTIQDIEYEGELDIENENHTLGNLLTRALQDHSKISFCGYKIDHPDINELVIKYKTEGKPFSKILQDVVASQTKIFESIIGKM